MLDFQIKLLLWIIVLDVAVVYGAKFLFNL